MPLKVLPRDLDTLSAFPAVGGAGEELQGAGGTVMLQVPQITHPVTSTGVFLAGIATSHSKSIDVFITCRNINMDQQKQLLNSKENTIIG